MSNSVMSNSVMNNSVMSHTLHTLSTSWQASPYIYQQNCFASKGDKLLLREDAVLSLHSPISLASFLAKSVALQIDVYALEPDCAQRGVRNRYSKIELISYEKFVELVASSEKVVDWL